VCEGDIDMTMTKPFSIYCDWGFHDELGDRVELTAQMAHTALDCLARWKEQHGVSYDYYLVDCFWFDPERGYRHFKKPHWPDGFEPVLKRLRELDMKPGLWYSTNGWQLKVPEWAPSLASSTCHYSLVDGPYAEELERAWMFAAETWHVRLLKLDFANFNQGLAGSGRADNEIYRESVRKLKTMLRRVKATYPDLKVIGHCGYQRAAHGIGPAGQHSPANDPAWLDVLDYLFSGDPLPSHVPRCSLPRAMDLFQDEQVYRLHRDGFPLDRIEDHGVMIGDTNTLMYRGREGFRRSHLGQLARGGRRDFFYGDPRFLTDADLDGLKATRALFFDAFERGLRTQFVGDGCPGTVQWHGYLTGGGDRGLLYLVNGTSVAQRVELPLPGLFAALPLFRDGVGPAVTAQPDWLTVELAPEEVTLIGLGEYAEDRYGLGASDDPPPRRVRLLPATFSPVAEGLFARLKQPLLPGERLVVTAELREAGALRAAPRRFGKQNTRESQDRRPITQDELEITVTSGGAPLRPLAQVPDVPVWAGMTWVSRTFRSAGDCEVLVRCKVRPPGRVQVAVQAVL
jgi:hypothetical protein